MADWKSNLINDAAGIQAMLRDTKTIAVLGIKPESHADQAAHYVPAHMAAAGYDVIPVPVYAILAKKPKYGWFQLGIRNDEAAQKLAEAGIKVVQDRCLMVEE